MGASFIDEIWDLNKGKKKKGSIFFSLWTEKRIKILLMCILAAFFLFAVRNYFIEKQSSWSPDYEKSDLAWVSEKELLQEEDYGFLLLQTGLGRAAVDWLYQENPLPEDRETELLAYQADFFSVSDYRCKRIGRITYEERNRGPKGEVVSGFRLATLRDGDILITKSAHSLGWRHGHAGIVTNGDKGDTLEAILWGYPSVMQSGEKWTTYASFIQLRLKGDQGDLGRRAAAIALADLFDLPYGLLTGIPEKSPDPIKKTQCAHLVWYPYDQLGYDLDSDGSWLVTPRDLAGSEYLEIVQIYGVSPDDDWLPARD